MSWENCVDSLPLCVHSFPPLCCLMSVSTCAWPAGLLSTLYCLALVVLSCKSTVVSVLQRRRVLSLCLYVLQVCACVCVLCVSVRTSVVVQATPTNQDLGHIETREHRDQTETVDVWQTKSNEQDLCLSALLLRQWSSKFLEFNHSPESKFPEEGHFKSGGDFKKCLLSESFQSEGPDTLARVSSSLSCQSSMELSEVKRRVLDFWPIKVDLVFATGCRTAPQKVPCAVSQLIGWILTSDWLKQLKRYNINPKMMKWETSWSW